MDSIKEIEEPARESLHGQIRRCGREFSMEIRRSVEDYLKRQHVSDLSGVDLSHTMGSRAWILNDRRLPVQTRTKYRGALERILVCFYRERNPQLLEKIRQEKLSRTKTNKVFFILSILDVSSPGDITWEIRKCFKEYLARTVVRESVDTYIKALDKVKLSDIRKRHNAFGNLIPEYEDRSFFLLYYPDYGIAKSFYYQQDKDELVFDFGCKAPTLMKRQIFSMIVHVLQTYRDSHDRRERFLFPLRMLYRFCVERSISDMMRMTQDDVDAFAACIGPIAGSKKKIYMQVIGNTERFLFLSAEKIPWEAHVWYLERLHFKEDRYNPANPVGSLSFRSVRIDENREDFKEYMMYLLGTAVRLSIQTIRCVFYACRNFLLLCDRKNIGLSEVDDALVNVFLEYLEEQELGEASFNRTISSVQGFMRYLQKEGKMKKLSLPLLFYYKKAYVHHNDRYVTQEQREAIFRALPSMSWDSQVIFEILYATGLRINEACQLRWENFSLSETDPDTAWLQMHQKKMKSDKNIPIPRAAYDAVQEYVQERHRKPDEYIFQDRKGEPARTELVTKRLKKELQDAGVSPEVYSFRSHDFRHTIATDMDSDGTALQATREYLGHKSDVMTEKYLDRQQEMMDLATEKFYLHTKGFAEESAENAENHKNT